MKAVIAISVGPRTSATAEAARARLAAAGYTVELFPSDGHAGRAMEAQIRAGRFMGVLDLTVSELADHLFGGLGDAGADRLTAAALTGLPQVIVPGGLDAIARETLLRTTPEQCDRLGMEIANRACAARGPTRVLLPSAGFSAHDVPGGPLWLPAANAAFRQSLRNWVYPPELLLDVDADFNDAAFADEAVRVLLKLM